MTFFSNEKNVKFFGNFLTVKWQFSGGSGVRDDFHILHLLFTPHSTAGNFYLNGGKISEVDISATNGVIHVIDRVMFPLNVILEMEGHDITVIG